MCFRTYVFEDLTGLDERRLLSQVFKLMQTTLVQELIEFVLKVVNKRKY